MKIVAISAGLGQPSSTRMLVDRLVSQITQQVSDAEVEVIEVRDLGHDLLNAEFTGVRSASVTKAQESISGADGLVVVTPVYNAHAAAVFHLFFEVLDEGVLEGKPMLVGATGGTARHSLVMDRDVVASLHYHHALVSPVSVFAATEDWGNPSALDRRIDRAARAFTRLLVGGTNTPGRDEGDSGNEEPVPGQSSHTDLDDGLGPVEEFEDMLNALGH
ncbi:NAD(P)H-dependent oxidoreductase [Cutibacterium equinum]|uniref:NAD(P)H-dependent oxidoreductase n=1 Tax=Cutibacterium equinum TaxID=3016342 RepID=A0ABY7QX61_9ACTN|nr:CE1759 family FMN reductase [Cutibacterium equinum]WCC79644.1 NAD(P)H-dependent oxidoreductase [Cutibacterium equinum]